MTYHRTVRMGNADIDELLEPVIDKLWLNGFETLFSCQGAPEGHIAAGRGYISGPLDSETNVPELVQILQTYLQGLKVTVTAGRWTADFDALDGTPVAPHVFVNHHWRILDLEKSTFSTL